MTDFPTQGEDQKVSLRNSNWPQFDFGYAEQLKEEHPTIWGAGGNIRGNEAYLLWEKARDGAETDGVLDWIKEREAWAARHAGDGSQFPGDEPTLSNIAGVVAAIKWGVILDIGEGTMKDAVRRLIDKQNDRTMEQDSERRDAPTIERRFTLQPVETRDQEAGDGRTVEGYAAVFETPYDMGPFIERVERSAFDSALEDSALDVVALFNHDQNQILARTGAGLELWTDDTGLKYRFNLGEQSYAQDLAISIRDGLVSQSSFAFSIESDSWDTTEEGRDRRTIQQVRLHDISPVVTPASPTTTATIRSQQPTQPKPAPTTKRDRAVAQLAIYNLNT